MQVRKIIFFSSLGTTESFIEYWAKFKENGFVVEDSTWYRRCRWDGMGWNVQIIVHCYAR